MFQKINPCIICHGTEQTWIMSKTTHEKWLKCKRCGNTSTPIDVTGWHVAVATWNNENLCEDISLDTLSGIDYIVLTNDEYVDASLKNYANDFIYVRIQRPQETLTKAIDILKKSAKSRYAKFIFLIQTHSDNISEEKITIPKNIIILKSVAYQILQKLQNRG